MLGTRERTLLLESLRPPAGYRLERAVGTSFTLDLIALLTAPLAFTFFDAHDERGEPLADPLALLEALRRHARKISLFCQAGAIAVPKPDKVLLAHLEGSVIEVRARMDAGVFHPKVWVLKFEADEQPPVFRFLCLSRNLTFDRAWDTCLCLEGPLRDRTRGYRRNAPLADFLAALPGLAVRPLAPELRDDLYRLVEEIRRVDFHPPPSFEDFRIHPLGLGRRRSWPFPEAKRSLAISPYLAGSVVDRLVRSHGLDLVISCPEALEGIPGLLPDRAYVLAPAARLDAREAEGSETEAEAEPPPAAEEPDLTGLHAKLFLFENGSTAYLFTGSANATHAAFALNVELLVELVGPVKGCGIASLLGDENDSKQDALRSLLQEYTPPETPEEVNVEQRELESRLERLAYELAAVRLTATVEESPQPATAGGAQVAADQLYEVRLSGTLPALPDGVEVRVWPVTLASETALPVRAGGDGTLANFRGLSLEALTAFVAFQVSLRQGRLSASRRFTVTVELCGAPDDRRERLLRSFLKNRRQVLRLLLLLLMDEGADVSLFVEAARDDDKAGRWSFGGWNEPTLLEALLQSLSRHPERVEQAARLIADLGRTPEGRDLLPEGLEEIWAPIWAAREELRR